MSADTEKSPPTEPQRSSKAKPVKTLPTDRLGFDKQMSVLRGYAAAAGHERNAVSNKEIAAIVQIHENTVSICNPFFADVSLITKEGLKNRPSEDVLDYVQALEWADSDRAAEILANVFRKTWFSLALIPKLSFRSLSKDEAVTFLASEAKAPKGYKTQLEILLDYLRTAGIIIYDGSTITLGPNAKEPGQNGQLSSTAQQIEVPAGNVALKAETPQLTHLHEAARKLDPLIQGLIDKLPDSGESWSTTERQKWLKAAEHIFALMYTDNEAT